MPTSKDLTDLDSQLKKTVISAESFRRGSSLDPSRNIANIHKTIGTLAGHTRKLVGRVISLEKTVENNSRKITSLKNISKTQSERISGTNVGAKLPGSSTSNVEDNISAITKSVSSIAEILSGRKKLLDNTAAYEKRKAEQEKRALAESKLEKRFDGLKKVAEKVIAPVKSILDKIIDFFVTVFLGRVVYKLLEWFGDPQNAKKVNSIIRFLGDHWPKLLSLYLVFGTSFGRFAKGLLKAVLRGTFKLTALIFKLAAAKKIRGARKVAGFLGGGKGKLLANVIGTGVALGGTYAVTQGLKGDDEKPKSQAYKGGGYVKPRFPAFSGGGFNFKGMMGGASLGAMFGPLGMLLGGAMGGSSGFVSGEKGVDKVPAMLSDGEFVMSRGAVSKYGVDTLEAMNAAGGGTNKPKIVSGTTYAAGGGMIGHPLDDQNYKDPILNRRLNLMKSLDEYGKSITNSKNGDSRLIGAINNLTSSLKTSNQTPSSGGGVTGYLMRAQKEAQKKIIGDRKTSVSSGGGSGAFLGARGYLSRVGNEISKKLSGGPKKKERESAPIDFSKMTSDVGGVLDTIRGVAGAAEEAIPALFGGIVGMNRMDTKISDDMQRALLAARKTAAERGRDYVDYKDYAENAGGMAASLTMGRIGDAEWKRDSKGRIIGLKQVYDTNRSAKEAMQQANDSLMDFMKTGSPKSLMRAIYKPGEALLAKVQERGTTTHDVNFSEKVLGFKSEAVKNQEALEKKRPWWDKMGWFGGASGEMERNKKYYGPGGDPSGSGKGQARQAKLAKTKPKSKPVKPPSSPKPKVVYGPPAPSQSNRYRGGQRASTKTPSFGAVNPTASNAKARTVGVRR